MAPIYETHKSKFIIWKKNRVDTHY